MTAVSEVRAAESVRRWLDSRADLWGPSSVEQDVAATLVETLARFCETVEREPDAIIEECLRPTPDSETYVLRTRARRHYMDEIARFEEQTGSRRQANAVRSFFIHNGVAMNAPILR